MKNAGLRAPRRCVARRRVHPDAPAMTSRSSTRRGQCSSPIPRPQSPPSLRGPGSGSAPSAVATRAKRNSCESWPETVSFATSPSSKGFGRRPRPWTVYAECLTRVLEGGGQALAQRLAGALTPTPDLAELAQLAAKLAQELHRTAQRRGVLRKDVSSSDILLLESLSATALPGDNRG